MCANEAECTMETVPSKSCRPDEICITVNVSAIVNGKKNNYVKKSQLQVESY